MNRSIGPESRSAWKVSLGNGRQCSRGVSIAVLLAILAVCVPASAQWPASIPLDTIIDKQLKRDGFEAGQKIEESELGDVFDAIEKKYPFKIPNRILLQQEILSAGMNDAKIAAATKQALGKRSVGQAPNPDRFYANGKPKRDRQGNQIYPNGQRMFNERGVPLYSNGKPKVDRRGRAMHSNGRAKFDRQGGAVHANGQPKTNKLGQTLDRRGRPIVESESP